MAILIKLQVSQDTTRMETSILNLVFEKEDQINPENCTDINMQSTMLKLTTKVTIQKNLNNVTLIRY